MNWLRAVVAIPPDPLLVAFALAVGVSAVPAAVSAHFKLVEPASWLIENERGDPQKAGPCGGTSTTTANQAS
jgi:hypothetical protein